LRPGSFSGKGKTGSGYENLCDCVVRVDECCGPVGVVKEKGKVEVRIVISEGEQVIEATASSGHPALRVAAVDAAREWVYKPTMFNGVPTKVETVLTFTFAPGSQ
jgi:TonB family protein